MKPDEAQIWLKKCIDSGLWVPGPSDDTEDAPPPPEECKSTVLALIPPITHDITSGAKAVQVSPGTHKPRIFKSCDNFTIKIVFDSLFYFYSLFTISLPLIHPQNAAQCVSIQLLFNCRLPHTIYHTQFTSLIFSAGITWSINFNQHFQEPSRQNNRKSGQRHLELILRQVLTTVIVLYLEYISLLD